MLSNEKSGSVKSTNELEDSLRTINEMIETSKNELDPILHSRLRLSIMSVLISVESADFSFLLEKTGATKGNLSAQLTKLMDAGYIEIRKSFRNNYPLTNCRISAKGIEAFEDYVSVLKTILKL